MNWKILLKERLKKMEIKDLKKTASLLAAPALVLCLSFFLWAAVDSMPEVKTEEKKEGVTISKSPFDEIDIVAKAAYVYDTRTGEVFYAKNEDLRLPLASVTKVMTALVASDLGEEESTITVDEFAILTEGDSGLSSGEKWSLKNILDFSLTSSSNDGMQAVANSLGALAGGGLEPVDGGKYFVREMNRKAEHLNMKNTYYFNPTGLDESNVQGGAYGTARDMAILFDHILRNYPSLLEATKEDVVRVASFDNNVHVARNTGLNVSKIPGIKGSKTGFTSIAGGNLVIAFDPELGRSIIVAVLGSTVSERFEDVNKLVSASLKEITKE